MNEKKRFACPQCGDTERLHINVATMARLIQHNAIEIETEIECDHEWEDTTRMYCSACGWHGVTKDADTLSAS